MEIKDIAEYLNIDVDKDLFLSVYDKVKGNKVNTFGKTPFECYVLENNMTGKPTGNKEAFEPILSQHRKVHPNYQLRSTGFNTADSTKKDVYPHTDIDFYPEHPNCYNIVIPIFGNSRIDYYSYDDDEVYLPEKNAHGEWYYHEFNVQKKMGQHTPEYEKFLSDRVFGHIVVDKPILIKTDIMHRVVVTEAPRCAWVTRWINIPAEMDYQKFKSKVESIL